MRILFQGDSITDAGRSREYDYNVGTGYPLYIKATLGLEYPDEFEFFNRGVGGDRIVDVYARIKRDIINLKPDVMSILIGVNDVWHEISECPNGVDADKFYRIYCMLLDEVKEALPNLKIMIMEPFVLKAKAREADWEYFHTEVKKRAQTAKKIADEYGLVFIPLQEGLGKLCEAAPPDYWVGDGVHPNCFAHEFIKREWIKAFNAL